MKERERSRENVILILSFFTHCNAGTRPGCAQVGQECDERGTLAGERNKVFFNIVSFVWGGEEGEAKE